MTDKQPEALRLADILEFKIPSIECLEKAAAELRRLHQSEREGWRYADELEQERKRLHEEIEALRTALAQPEPEPVAWVSHNAGLYHGKPDESLNPLPLYLAPPQREWQVLTDKEYETMAEHYVTNCYFDTLKYAKAVEAKLKEKNT